MRKEKKSRQEFNNEFIELFNAFKSNSILKLFRLIKSIGMEKIEKIFNAVGAIWYDPTKKQISTSRSGKAVERKPISIEQEKFDSDKYFSLRKESIKTESEIDEKERTETYVVVENLQNIRVRIDMEKWFIILGYGGFSQIFDQETRKSYQFKNPDKNEEILYSFLDYLEKKYKKFNIIKKNETLID